MLLHQEFEVARYHYAGESCPIHHPNECACMAISRMSPLAREEAQDAILLRWLNRSIAKRIRAKKHVA